MLMYRIPQYVNYKHFLMQVAKLHTTKVSSIINW